jgi:hypothetical protein
MVLEVWVHGQSAGSSLILACDKAKISWKKTIVEKSCSPHDVCGEWGARERKKEREPRDKIYPLRERPPPRPASSNL